MRREADLQDRTVGLAPGATGDRHGTAVGHLVDAYVVENVGISVGERDDHRYIQPVPRGVRIQRDRDPVRIGWLVPVEDDRRAGQLFGYGAVLVACWIVDRYNGLVGSRVRRYLDSLVDHLRRRRFTVTTEISSPAAAREGEGQ